MAASRRDLALIFATRVVRLAAYGLLSVVLVLYLSALGVSEAGIGLLLTLSLIGDVAVSFWMATWADRLGRRRMLRCGAVLMGLAGAVFLVTRDFTALALGATVGILSPSGSEIGPFLSIEQAALAQLLPDARRTRGFAWYTLVGSAATAAGSLSGGALAQLLRWRGFAPLDAYRGVLLGYLALAGLLAVLFFLLSPAVEAPAASPSGGRRFGLLRSRGVVLKLSGLFALDAFAGGFVVQSLLAYWLHLRFGLDAAALGAVFFGANLVAGASALLAAGIAARIGLVRTMVFTHIPSSLLLVTVAFAPSFEVAAVLFLLREGLVEMDVPTRQSYVLAVVQPEERTFASGVTNLVRLAAWAVAPAFAGALMNNDSMYLPLVIGAGMKIAYDLLLWRAFRAVRPPEESAAVE